MKLKKDGKGSIGESFEIYEEKNKNLPIAQVITGKTYRNYQAFRVNGPGVHGIVFISREMNAEDRGSLEISFKN